jgi:hypothetical protein
MENNENTQEDIGIGGSTVDSSSDAVKTLQAAMDAEASKAEDTTTEAPKAEEQPKVAEEPKQDERFAAKFAALSRKEKEVRQREAQLQQKMQELEAKLKAIESQQTEVQTFKAIPERLKREPLKVLEESGLSFEQLAEMVVNDGKPTQDMLLKEYEQKVMSKVQELEKKLAEKEEQEKAAKEAELLGQFQTQLVSFIEQTPDYELIRANDAAELVYQVIEQHAEEHGEILSNKEACDAVEEYLLEEAKKLVDREKVKKLLQPTQAPSKPTTPQTAAKTLSNTQAAQVPKSGAAKSLSAEESKLEAAKLIKWIE